MPIETVASNETFTALAAWLNDAGLGALFSVTLDGQPGGWLWDQITNGVDSADQLAIAIEQTDAFRQRYGVILDLRARAAAGEPVVVPTVATVREYEDTVTRIMRRAGLPTWFYDSYTDAQDLMSKGFSASEVEARLGNAWDRVQNTDPAIRNAFTTYYGVAAGTAALAAWYLDPARTEAAIEKASRAAYTAGTAQTMGLDISQQTAEAVAMSPRQEAGIAQDLGTAASMSPLYTEGITETADLTADQGVRAAALGDGEASGALRRRSLERQANDRSAFGGAASTQAGVSGLSNA